MSSTTTQPVAWILHEGELADVRAQLAELGVESREADAVVSPDALRTAALVAATPDRVAPLRALGGGGRPLRLVVQDWGDRGGLARGDFDVLLRRPFHASTLRFLAQQALYAGTERRRTERVPMGFPVRFRAGFWKRSALLVELSMGGCRLISEHGVRSGQRLTVYVPSDWTHGRELAVTGRAVRFSSGDGVDAHEQTIGVDFDALPGITWEALRNVLTRRQEELTTLPAAVLDAGDEPSGDEDEASECGADKRRAPRRAYGRRVIALGRAQARVLIARDLSPGGMRADPTPHLQVGEDVRIALHVQRGHDPLVVEAHVARDDGERGLVLLFRNPSPAALDYLQKMLHVLPVLEAGEDGAADRGPGVEAEIVEDDER